MQLLCCCCCCYSCCQRQRASRPTRLPHGPCGGQTTSRHAPVDADSRHLRRSDGCNVLTSTARSSSSVSVGYNPSPRRDVCAQRPRRAACTSGRPSRFLTVQLGAARHHSCNTATYRVHTSISTGSRCCLAKILCASWRRSHRHRALVQRLPRALRMAGRPSHLSRASNSVAARQCFRHVLCSVRQAMGQ